MQNPGLALLILIAALLAQPVAACGADTDCDLGGRHYRIYLPPERGVGPVGALVFSHGYRGSAAGVMRNNSLRRLADELGVALIAGKSAGPDWAIDGAPSGSAKPGDGELAYFDAVIADATRRFGIDPGRIVATGFSAGGMMTWTLACHRGDRFAGFIPYSGTFWEPMPAECDSPPASLVHLHGTSDRTVPMGGRPIQDSRQGDVDGAIAMYAAHGGFGAAEPRRVGDLACKMRHNDRGQILNLCMFDGGHSFRTALLRRAWQMLAEAGAI